LEELMKSDFTRHISQSYDQHTEKYISVLEPMLAPMAAEMVRMAELKPGQRALDLATGTALIARAMAGGSAIVMGADFASGILRLADSLSQGAIPFTTADAHQLPYEDGFFDVITCGLSLSHFSDIDKALAEIRRVLHPGGRLIASAWGKGSKNPTRDAAREVRHRYLPEQEAALGGMLNEDLWAVSEKGCRALERAGFADVNSTTSALSGCYPDHNAAAEAALAWPITRYKVAQLKQEEQERLKKEIASAVQEVSDLNWWIEILYYEGSRAAAS
jgi:ubiquinone/menaquinone biosynthesis C-methylase UbiE